MTSSSLIWLAVIALVLWRMYSRIRRLVGRQRSVLRRHVATLIVFPLLLVMLALSALRHPLSLTALAGGLLAGIALAWWGLQLTRYETTAEGYFYTPNAHIGIALSLLFIGRILYRVVQIGAFSAPDAAQFSGQDFSRSPLTLLCFGTLAGYYVAYAIGILRWRSQAKPEVRAKREEQQAAAAGATAAPPPGSVQ
jgi:hypothetical protein